MLALSHVPVEWQSVPAVVLHRLQGKGLSDMEKMYQTAYQEWSNGKPLVAGQLLFEDMERENVPEWCFAVLTLATKWIQPTNPVKRLLALRSSRWRWRKSRCLFHVIRDQTLQLEATTEQTVGQRLTLSLCYLAENVAKTVFNSLDTEDAFDEDSGWWIVVCLRHCVDCVGKQEFLDQAEKLLFGVHEPR